MSNAYEPTDETVTSEPLGDEGRVIRQQNEGTETPGGGEFPDHDTPPDESAGAPAG